MAITITVSAKNISDADAYLTQYLQDNITDAEFGIGSSTRDFCVNAIARIFAYFQSEVSTARAYQSLLNIETLPSSTDRDEAADAILSNLLVKRNPGRPAHLPVRLHFNQPTDVTIGTTVRFFRTANVVFKVDRVDTYTAGAGELTPSIASDGTVIDYTLDVSMAAAAIGTQYNVPIGRFASTDAFNPYFTYAENTSDAGDGLDPQTTDQMIAEAPDAISVRNLVNEKSISIVLKTAFSDISRVVVTGFGDPEMVRDLSTEAVTGLRMHTGGFYDAFVNLPLSTVTETLTVGGLFARPDNRVVILRDTAGFGGVTPGMVLRVSAGLSDVPRVYIITAVTSTYIEVNTRTPFVTATDEASPPATVTYTIGTSSPDFSNIIGTRTTGATSRKQGRTCRVTLLGQPQYQIRDVQLLDGSNPPTVMGPRTNLAPTAHQFQVITENPGAAQSNQVVSEIVLPTLVDGVSPDTKLLQITYDTLVDYPSVQTLLVDKFTRTICSNSLARGFHPVYCAGAITYDLKNGATSVPDNDVMAAQVAAYINSFPTTDALSAPAIQSYLQSLYPDVSRFYPFSVTYSLLAPDGQVYTYGSSDVLRIYPDDNHAAQLVNGADLRSPLPDAGLPPVDANLSKIAAANAALEFQLGQLGVTDNVVRYLANSTDFVCSLRG